MGYGVIGNTPVFGTGVSGSSPGSPASSFYSLQHFHHEMTMNFSDMVLLSGNANPKLTKLIGMHLERPVGNEKVGRFADGEINVDINVNVRGRDVFIIQSTSQPANDHLMELLILADACKRASAGRITAVIPYYGYSRQDRKVSSRAPITAKLVADMLCVAGVSRVLTMDLHAGQIQGFFDIPVDNLYAVSYFCKHIKKRLTAAELENLVVVSPDAGGVERARLYGKRLNAQLAIIDKRREKANQSEVMHLIGSVEGKTAIIVDDMVDTAGTLTKAAVAVMEQGAKNVYACCAHPVLSHPAVERIAHSPIKKLFVTDAIQLADHAAACKTIEVVSVAVLIGEAIEAVHNNLSISRLFV